MMRFMEAVTEEPGWERRVTDQTALENWRTKASSQYGLSTQAWAWCQAELQDPWASDFKRTGYVMVFDADSRVCKSNTLIDRDLCQDISKPLSP